MLSDDGNNILTYGLEKSNDIIQQIKSDSIQQCIEFAEVILSSIPLSKDKIYVNAPFSKENIQISTLSNELINNNTRFKSKIKFIAGNIPKEQFASAKIDVIDLLENESLTISNAIPSAEGAIQIAMEESLKTIHGSNVLIMGFGRIGKILSKMLNGIGANVFCEARKATDIAWINAYGYSAIELNNLDSQLHKFDIIFNTIPFVLLNEQNLKLLKKDCLIIDLASKPGGVDFESAQKLGIKTNWALGLPGKVAPETAASGRVV